MAAFYIDADVSPVVADELNGRGHDALSCIRDGSPEGRGDEQVFFTAVEQARVVVTHNERDFTLLHRAWLHWRLPRQHYGLLIVRQNLSLRPPDIADWLHRFTEQYSAINNSLFLFRRNVNTHQPEWIRIP